jgi:hypothetical protein
MKYGGLNRIRRLGIFLGLIVIGVIAVVGGQVGRQTSPGGGTQVAGKRRSR